jgi:Uma2 family endonuclease
MSEARRRWSLQEFLEWDERQDGRYEFVDGEPRMMTGVTQAHSTIAANIISALRAKLRGSGCRAHGPELRMMTGAGNIRLPDALIDCGAFRPEAREASHPIAVFEVLSRSTAWTDLHRKLRDYEATASVLHYVIIAQEEPRAELWTRDPAGHFFRRAELTSLAEAVVLEPPGISLAMAEIYEGLEFSEQVVPA